MEIFEDEGDRKNNDAGPVDKEVCGEPQGLQLRLDCYWANLDVDDPEVESDLQGRGEGLNIRQRSLLILIVLAADEYSHLLCHDILSQSISLYELL